MRPPTRRVKSQDSVYGCFNNPEMLTSRRTPMSRSESEDSVYGRLDNPEMLTSRCPPMSRSESRDSVYARLDLPDAKKKSSRNPRKRSSDTCHVINEHKKQRPKEQTPRPKEYHEEEYSERKHLSSETVPATDYSIIYSSEYVESEWESKNKWWEVVDPLTRALAMFIVNPLSDQICKQHHPKYFTKPKFVEFSFSACPIAHLQHYKTQMILWNSCGELMCRIFHYSLGSTVKDYWYYKLSEGSISKWSQLMTGFVLRFKSNMVSCRDMYCICKNAHVGTLCCLNHLVRFLLPDKFHQIAEEWKSQMTVCYDEFVPSEKDWSSRKSRKKWWEIYDLVKRCLAMLEANPLSDKIYRSCQPKYFNMPTFVLYDGNACPIGHLYHYQDKMYRWDYDDDLMCKVFQASLGPVALLWFYKLTDGSIKMWSQLWTAFAITFADNHALCSTIDCFCKRKR